MSSLGAQDARTDARVERTSPIGDVQHHGRMHARRRTPVALAGAALLALAAVVAGCDAGPASTPPITPGSSASPREVNIIAREYTYVPDPVDLVPGETVLLHVVNGGLETHEVVIGDSASQFAWDDAEAAVAEHPPGPTPVVAVPPGFDGIRIVVGSGARVDATWTVPADAAARSWFVGCHIPGHFSKGMIVPVRFVGPDGRPMPVPSLIVPSLEPSPA
jgi:FtsP/CotA-like multicopper oxidase with cupredoxin domain